MYKFLSHKFAKLRDLLNVNAKRFLNHFYFWESLLLLKCIIKPRIRFLKARET